MTQLSQHPLDEFEESLVRRLYAAMGFAQEAKRQPRRRLIESAESLELRQMLSATGSNIPQENSYQDWNSQSQRLLDVPGAACPTPHFLP